jgi:hypothetical protein
MLEAVERRALELAVIKPSCHITDDVPCADDEAAAFLGVTRNGLRKWRQKTRSARKTNPRALIGPAWIEYGEGKGCTIRYLPSVLRAYRDAHIPFKPAGRPRKIDDETATAVAGAL